MSTINHRVIATRLTPHRLTSYLAAASGDLTGAIGLYDWCSRVGGAMHEDLGRIEVVLRNALDDRLVTLGTTRQWSTVWYRRSQLFPGKHGVRALDDVAAARSRAVRRGGPELHGKVIAELSFGFWRYLCTKPYLTTLWVPALARAFPFHPRVGDPFAVRRDIDRRVQQLHFLRNRIAHHEPIHRRDLRRDHAWMMEVAGWICPDTRAWIAGNSRTLDVLAARPALAVRSRGRRGGG